MRSAASCGTSATARTTCQIIRALCQRYTLHRKEAEVSVVAYLRQLAKRGLIGIALLKETEKGPGGKQS